MQTELSLVLEKTWNRQTKDVVKGAGESARHRWRELLLRPAQTGCQEGVPVTTRAFHSMESVGLLSLLPALLLLSLKPTFRQFPSAEGLGWNEFGAFPYLSLLPLCFLSIPQPLSVFYFVLFILTQFHFFLPLCSPLFFLFFFFVKPSSFKIMKWWVFGWGNNTLKKNTYIRKPFFISGTVKPLFQVMKV